MREMPTFHKEVFDRWAFERGGCFDLDNPVVYEALRDFIMWREPQVIPVKDIRRELPDV
jgi:hypothetical protein